MMGIKQEELIAAVRYAGLLDYALVADAALFIESDAEGRAGCESTPARLLPGATLGAGRRGP